MDRFSKLDLFVDYVKSRNIHLMTKSDWEMYFFYCYVKDNYKVKSLQDLDKIQIGQISDDLSLTYKQVSALISKCYPLEAININKSFAEMINAVVENKNFEVTKDGVISFEVSNPIMLEIINRKIREGGYLRDTSFNYNIVVLSIDAFLALAGISTSSFTTKITNDVKSLFESCKNVAGVNSLDGEAVDRMVHEIQVLKGKHVAENVFKVITKGIDVLTPVDGVTALINYMIPRETSDN